MLTHSHNEGPSDLKLGKVGSALFLFVAGIAIALCTWFLAGLIPS